MLRRLFGAAVGMTVVLTLFAPAATAKSAAVTKIWFKLDEHVLDVGDEVSGRVLVLTKSRFLWWPLAKVPLSISVDGDPVGTTKTGILGFAKVEAIASSPGEHTIEVAFAGNAKHQPASASEPFTVLGGPPPPQGAPDAPVLTDASGAPAPGLAYLEWQIPADNGSAITAFRVYRRTANGQFEFLLAKNNPSAMSADDVNVIPGTTYVYVVTAVNAMGESAWSNEVAITPF